MCRSLNKCVSFECNYDYDDDDAVVLFKNQDLTVAAEETERLHHSYR